MTSPSSRRQASRLRPIRSRPVWSRPMAARDATESHRTATPLELFFDLCFVVSVSAVSGRLHHALIEDHAAAGLVSYAILFFAIWWAWMNFTWFASAYDTDDIAYRLTTFVQIAGVLVLAAGVPRAFDDHNFTIIVTGYAIMRVGLVIQWLRVANGDPAGRRTAQRFAIGVSACMVGWLAWLFLPQSWQIPFFLIMATAELCVPLWAENARNTPWHPRHIAERYGLFTLIVLGETVLSATNAVQRGLAIDLDRWQLFGAALCGLIIVFGMWWLYFGQHAERFLRSNREGFRWGYGHYVIFAAAAAVGTGLEVVIDHINEVGHTPTALAGGAVAVPVAVFIVCVWLLQVRPHRPGRALDLAFPAAAIIVLATLATPWAVAATATAMIALVATTVLLESGPRATS